jgi:hypothetical protein
MSDDKNDQQEADRQDAREDVDSVSPNDSSTEVESKILGLDDLTGSPTEAAKDAEESPTDM